MIRITLRALLFVCVFFSSFQDVKAKDQTNRGGLLKVFNSFKSKFVHLKELLPSFLLPDSKKENTDDGIEDSSSILQTPSSSSLDDNFILIDSRDKSFMMGSPRSEEGRESDEGGRYGKPVRVKFSYSFMMLKTEVTQEEWFEIMGDGPSYFNERQYCENDYKVVSTDRGDIELCLLHPVESVSWNDVQEFLKRLNIREGLSNCHKKKPEEAVDCYRLPTEAEWEYAVRGGTQTAYFFGDNPDLLGDYAWYKDNSDEQTHEVGLKLPNAYGLHDMHGNVWEWVQNVYTKRLPGGENPLKNFGSFRVIRGGGWDFYAPILRCAVRNFSEPGPRYGHVGFRIVKTL